MKKMYVAKLVSYGLNSDVYIHSTRLKLAHFPDMLAVSEGHGHKLHLMFDQNRAHTLHKACQYDADTDGIHLV